MSEILFRYERVNPTSWAYLSSLLSLALFFKFSRFWTIRNLDLLLVILLTPAMLCIKLGLDAADEGAGELDWATTIEQFGYIWLFSVNLLLLIRALLDPLMVRRPLLEANLSIGGLSFLGVSLMAFLTANIINGVPDDADVFAAQRADHLSKLESSEVESTSIRTHGPGFPILYWMPYISTQRLLGPEEASGGDAASGDDMAGDGVAGDAAIDEAAASGTDEGEEISRAASVTAKVMAIVAQMLIIIGMVLIAARHFDNVAMGIAAATFYLLMPYTAMWMGAVTHALPGALLVWGVLFYRRPVFAGLMIGLLAGTIYYTLFLLPLWFAFYWRRGAGRFAIGVLVAVTVLIIALVFTSSSPGMFFERIQQMFGLQLPQSEGLGGAWGYWSPYYRWPLFALFVGLALSFVLWPVQKNLATLLSCSAGLMIGTQFWHAHTGGMAIAWYAPVLLLMIFRPNLEDRVAVEVVKPTRWERRRAARA